MPTCIKCLVDKPSDEFYVKRARPSGLNSSCKTCWKAYQNARRRPGKYLREQYLLKNYGLSSEQYAALLSAQNGLCALCGEQETGVGKGGSGLHLAVDHDWKCCTKRPTCGKCTRGLLCRRCNQILGRVNEDVDLLTRMVTYVQRERGSDRSRTLSPQFTDWASARVGHPSAASGCVP